MFFDLNVPFPTPAPIAEPLQSKKQKKQKQKGDMSISVGPVVASHPLERLRTPDRDALRQRLETLIHLGYSVVALNQTIYQRFDPSTHVNVFEGGGGTVFKDLDPRFGGNGLIQLRRLTLILDESSEKGFGLTNQCASQLANYDILSLQPTTMTSFQQVCLSQTLPSSLTSHIISVDLSVPRLPFYLKHSLVKTALKNGARFEICYAGALAEQTRRNWWAGAREIVRVASDGVLLSCGGTGKVAEIRAPNDVINLATVLGLNQAVARDALSKGAKSLIMRAETRKTYRAVLSEPTLILPAEGPQGPQGVVDAMEDLESRGEKRVIEEESDDEEVDGKRISKGANKRRRTDRG